MLNVESSVTLQCATASTVIPEIHLAIARKFGKTIPLKFLLLVHQVLVELTLYAKNKTEPALALASLITLEILTRVVDLNVC
jgi:hypothetical protein